jgi:hypothetical protein
MVARAEPIPRARVDGSLCIACNIFATTFR